MLEHLHQLLLVISTVLTESLLYLVEGAKLCLQHSLSLFFLLDLFMNFGDLIASFSDLLGLIAWIKNHVVIESFLKACFLGQEIFGLLLILRQTVVQGVNLGLILDSDALDRRIYMSLHTAVHGCGAEAAADP